MRQKKEILSENVVITTWKNGTDNHSTTIMTSGAFNEMKNSDKYYRLTVGKSIGLPKFEWFIDKGFNLKLLDPITIKTLCYIFGATFKSMEERGLKGMEETIKELGGEFKCELTTFKESYC